LGVAPRLGAAPGVPGVIRPAALWSLGIKECRMAVRVGCCGFSMARVEYYRRFPVVEIQQTFYNLPRIATAERWCREALACRPRNGPADFEFTMKAWQLITHEASSPTYRRLRKAIP